MAATSEGVRDWTDYVLGLGSGLLMNEIGLLDPLVSIIISRGKKVPRIMRYSGGITLQIQDDEIAV